MKSLKDRIASLEAKVGTAFTSVEIDERAIDFRSRDTLPLTIALFRRIHAQIVEKPIPISRFDSTLDSFSQATSVTAKTEPLIEATWRMLREAADA